MKKLSLVEKITQGTEEAEKKKLATDETTEGNAPGDVSGDPLYNIPTKKTDEQMNQDPKEVLNSEVASEMGATDTIESLIKKVVTEAIKEAATPEGHVDTKVVGDMGAPKMSAVKMSKTMNYRGFIIEIRDSTNGKTEIIIKGKDFGSGEVVDNVFVEEEAEAFKVGKEAINELLEKSKFSKTKMSAAKLARYKGVSYEIESKGSSPNTKYYGVCEELDIKTGPMISPSDAGYEIRILIDESIKDRDTKMSRMAKNDIQKMTGTISLQIPYEVWVWPDGQYEFKNRMNATGQSSSDTLDEHAIKVVKSKLGL